VPWPTAVISVVVLSAVVLSVAVAVAPVEWEGVVVLVVGGVVEVLVVAVAVGPVAALSTGPKLTLANARPPPPGTPSRMPMKTSPCS
jgi:hypothetical protein